jgi:hypothetical protein
MTDEDKPSGPTQQTQPKKGAPVVIPVPKRSAFDKLVKRAAKTSATGRRRRASK